MSWLTNPPRHVKIGVLSFFLLAGVMAWSALASQSTPTLTSPYPASSVISGVTWDFDNLLRLAPGSDLWPTTWAADDHIYTSWGDGGGFGGTNSNGRVSLGFARLEGPSDNFTSVNVWGGKNGENPATFDGKAAGMLSVNGVLYAWVNLQNASLPDHKLAWSDDLGATWQLASWAFSGSDFVPGSFLNFGKDYAGARDNYVYAYGAKPATSKNVYLVRVPKNSLLTQSAYEFFKGLDANDNPLWTTNISQRAPVFTDPNDTGAWGALHASVIYNDALNRYLLTIPHADNVAQWGIFDAPEPWGPWTTVAYYNDWGNFGSKNDEALLYYVPTKWISADGAAFCLIFSGTGEFDSFNILKGVFSLSAAQSREITTPTANRVESVALAAGALTPEAYLPLVSRGSGPCFGQ